MKHTPTAAAATTATATRRPANISATRLELEALLAANDTRTWTVRQMRRAMGGATTVANYVESLRGAGLIRLVGTDEATSQRLWVWHTSSIRATRATLPTMAQPRVYVNAAMPNGTADYWRAALSWGR